MTPRLPILALLGALGGGLLITSVEGSRPTIVTLDQPLAAHSTPIARPQGVAATWYCAAGTAEAGGLADHMVVVANPTATPVEGLLTVFAGEFAPPPPVPDSAETADTADTTPATTVPAPAAARVEPPGGAPAPAAEAVSAAPTTGPATPMTPAAEPQPDPEPIEQRFSVGPHDRTTFRLADLRSAPLAAALVEVDTGGVVVAHELAGPSGRESAPCASAAASEWHFALGSTAKDARDLLVLFNPFPNDVTVDGVFSGDEGRREPVRWQGLTVPARSAIGVDVGDDVTRRDQVAASIRARGGRLVVERVQTFDGSRGVAGLSVALGQPAPSDRWVFAHGRVDEQVSEHIVLYNPGRQTAEVDVSVLGLPPEADPDADPEAAAVPASPQPFGIVVRAGEVEVLDYGAEARVARGIGHATVVQARNGIPVVAERLLNFGGEVSAGAGARFPAAAWVFPAIETGPDRTTRLVVMNPDPERATRVSLRVHAAARRIDPPELEDVDVPAGGRVELALPPGLPEGPLSVVARAESPVVVERVDTRAQREFATHPGVPLL